MKKLVSYFLSISVLLSLLVTTALADTQSISILKGTNMVNAGFNGTRLAIKENGSVQYNNVNISFQFGQIEFEFNEMGEGVSTVLKASVAGNTYTATLSDSNKVVDITNPTVVKGTHNFTFAFSKPITISK